MPFKMADVFEGRQGNGLKFVNSTAAPARAQMYVHRFKAVPNS